MRLANLTTTALLLGSLTTLAGAAETSPRAAGNLAPRQEQCDGNSLACGLGCIPDRRAECCDSVGFDGQYCSHGSSCTTDGYCCRNSRRGWSCTGMTAVDAGGGDEEDGGIGLASPGALLVLAACTMVLLMA
ncbi:hypothetical protein N658DRAFT_500516 [Parathielavia hyrcaniae]|uniref:Uncharacterized protein n=1 Tax=Parathielavia hyrcaniae TaxID=113614 RepID=A0AAN6SYD1_9PEZI|nr:hypothetical protein N658DRAFT_500516 [Parathielavia hyrcaniae]